MKTIRTALFSLLVVMSVTAMADAYPPTKTYEATVHKLRLPTTSNGTIAVRESEKDDFETYRVTERTLYLLNGNNMRLDDFRAVIENLRLDGDKNVNVVRNIETNTITKVYVNTQ